MNIAEIKRIIQSDLTASMTCHWIGILIHLNQWVYLILDTNPKLECYLVTNTVMHIFHALYHHRPHNKEHHAS